MASSGRPRPWGPWGWWAEDLALALLQELGATVGLRATVVSYGAAQSACEGAKQWPTALQLLLELGVVGLRADDVALNTALGLQVGLFRGEKHRKPKVFDGFSVVFQVFFMVLDRICVDFLKIYGGKQGWRPPIMTLDSLV